MSSTKLQKGEPGKNDVHLSIDRKLLLMRDLRTFAQDWPIRIECLIEWNGSNGWGRDPRDGFFLQIEVMAHEC